MTKLKNPKPRKQPFRPPVQLPLDFDSPRQLRLPFDEK